MNTFLMTLGCMVLSASLYAMDNAYLKIGGIAGESKDQNHQEWFEVVSFDQGPYRWTKVDGSADFLPKESGSLGQGSLTVTRIASHSAPEVYKAVLSGTFFGNVQLDVPVHSGMGKRYVRWELSDVIPTSIHADRSKDRRGAPIEQITFSFQRAIWKHPETEQPVTVNKLRVLKNSR